MGTVLPQRFVSIRLRIVAYLTVSSLLWSGSLGIQQPAKAQLAPIRDQKETDKKKQSGQLSDVFLPAPRELNQLVSRARKSLEERRYTDAVNELGSLLTSPDAEDYFILREDQPGTTISLKAEARRLLGSMPARGRESYELQFGADARRLLNEALDEGDVRKLTDASRKFFHTESGYDATYILGRHHLDRGRPLAAALALERIAETINVADKYEPELSISLALAWFYAGMETKAEEALINLKQAYPDTNISIGNHKVSLFDDDADAIAWLHEQIGNRRTPQMWEEQQWLMYRGNASRTARSAGGSPLITGSNPLVNCRWRVPIANDRSLESELERMQRQYLGDQLPALPTMHPLAVGDVILVRTPDLLVAIDFDTGKRVWYFGERMFDEAESPLTAGRPEGLWSTVGRGSGGLQMRMWDDAPFGRITSDGKRVFLLNDLGYPTTRSLSRVIVMPNGRQMLNPDWPKTHNQLVALELASEGKLLWEVGGKTGQDEPRLAGAFFLGPALPLSGQLYVLAEINGEIRLVVLDPQTGTLQWSQQLVHVNDAGTVVTNAIRRVSGATPSYADGVLICPTAAGAVVAVDVANRSLRWGHQYMRTQQPRKPGIWARSPLQLAPGQPGTRWSDDGITIAGGHVVVTPPESTDILCLNLLDGTPIWNRERGDSLFVACVDNNILVIVGKHQVMGIHLKDGSDAWSAPLLLPKEAMPSGRGFLTDHSYYLPTTAGEVVKIHVHDGLLEKRYPTGNVLGNLVCYRDNVITQGVDYLSAFYQTEPLRRLVEERLAADPNDARALAQKGQLLLHDGQQHEALIALRRSQELNSDDATRALLVDTLLRALRADFTSNGHLAGEVEDLIDQPQQRSEYLRLMTDGLQQTGKMSKAFDVCLELMDMGQPRSQVEEVEPQLSLRRDRWIRSNLTNIMAAASAKDRKNMDELLLQKLESAIALDSSAALRQVAEYFGGHSVSSQAQLRLAERLIDSNELLEANVILTRLAASKDETLAAPAIALSARLLEKASRYETAADFYRLLLDRFSDTDCIDGMTGRELYERVESDSTIGRLLATQHRWPRGKSIASRKRRQSNRGQSNLPRAFTLADIESHGPGIRDLQISLNMQRMIIGKDGLGRQQFRASLIQPHSPIQTLPGNLGLSRGRASGHLLIATYGFHVLAIDTLGTDEQAADRILWRQDAKILGNGNGNSFQFRQRPVTNIWGQGLPVTQDHTANSTTRGKRVGALGPLNDHGICFQRGRELLCVDPLRVNVDPIWIRHGVPPGCDLFGDENYLFVIPPDQTEATVLSPADGKLLGPREVPDEKKRWVTHGRFVLTWQTRKDHLELMLYDPWYEENVWSHSFTVGSKGCLIERDEVGVMQPDGRFVVIGLDNGTRKIDEQLQPEESLESIHILRSSDQYLLVTNTPAPPSQQNVTFMPAPAGQSSPLIHGRIYAFDRFTGRTQWPVPAVIGQYGLPLDQPSDLPVLLMLRHVRRTKGRNKELKTAVLCLDRRNGRILLQEDELAAPTGSYNLVGNPDTNTVSLDIPAGSFTIEFTDDPTPPEPPAQTGDASSLVEGKPGKSFGRIAEAIIDALGNE